MRRDSRLALLPPGRYAVTATLAGLGHAQQTIVVPLDRCGVSLSDGMLGMERRDELSTEPAQIPVGLPLID